MANQALNVKIGADIKNLRDEMAKARGIIGNFTNQIGNIKSMLAGAFAVGSVVAFGKAAYDAAAEAMEGERKLLIALNGRRDAQERLLQQAEILHQTTLFEDDEIVKQQALLAAMGRNEEQIKAVITAAVNLASATGTDLSSAVTSLNKALEGNYKSLFAIDPTLKAMIATQGEHANAVQLVTEKYAGFATQLSQVGGGPLVQTQKILSEITESLGRELLPGINKVLQFVNLMTGGKAIIDSSYINAVKQVKKLRQQAAIDKDIDKWKTYNDLLQKGVEEIRAFAEANGLLNKPLTAAQASPGTKGVKDLLALSEQQRMARIAALQRSQAGGTGNAQNPLSLMGAYSAMAQAQKQLSDTTASIQEGVRAQMQKTISMAAQFATVISDNFAAAASGQITYGQAIARSTIQIVNSLRDQAIAGIIAGTAKGPLSKINPIAAVALAAAASAGISALFGRLSSARRGGGFGGAGGGGEGGFAGTRLESLGMRVELQLAGDAGRMFKATITNQDRIDQRTKG